jgi:hypothetical protein
LLSSSDTILASRASNFTFIERSASCAALPAFEVFGFQLDDHESRFSVDSGAGFPAWIAPMWRRPV